MIPVNHVNTVAQLISLPTPHAALPSRCLIANERRAEIKLVGCRLLLFGLLGVLLSLPASGQLEVDATGPIPGRVRTPTAGRSGSLGRKLALQVVMETTGSPPNDSQMTTVRFTLTNTSKTVLTLPISPHPRDLEPSDPSTSYSIEVLSLYVTSGKKQDSMLRGRADLYGRHTSPESFVKLAPGESLRVLTQIEFPHPKDPSEATEEIFVGHAVLDDETVKSLGDQTVEDSQELGAASSVEYTTRSLNKVPE